MAKVVIFAGHDHDTWETLGAKGVRTDLEKDGVYEEYDTNFLIAKGAVKILQTVPGLTVYFPQADGRKMTLKQRVDYANSIGADLLIDIHSNAAASRTATGAAAFYWKGSTNGKRAADIYAGHLKKATFPLWSGGTYASNMEDGWSGFYMLRYSNMPAILLENFFFTTRNDLEKYLLNPSVQLTLMEIVADTATDYFGIKKPAAKPIPVQVSKPAASAPAPSYPSAVSDRRGEVRLKADAIYRETPADKGKVITTLKKGHTCHYYDMQGHWVRLGNGWVKSMHGSVVEIVKKYDDLYRVSVDGKPVNSFNEVEYVLDEVAKAVKAGKSAVIVEKV